MKLLFQAFTKLLSGLLLLGVLLFIPANTFNFPGAWRMICVLFIPMIILGTALFIFKPELLKKRLNQNEQEKEQKQVILISAIVFILSFLLCGFDYRYAWTHVPKWLSILACIIFIITYLGFVQLLRENECLSRTVEVQENQKVISSGLYGIVRHPMYAIIFWMFISMPIIIGSFLGLIPLILLPYILVKRILNEEEVLTKDLNGYSEYKKKVKYRIIPFIW